MNLVILAFNLHVKTNNSVCPFRLSAVPTWSRLVLEFFAASKASGKLRCWILYKAYFMRTSVPLSNVLSDLEHIALRWLPKI